VSELLQTINDVVENKGMERSVLIVDDEENLLVLLDRIFGKEGYQVKTASNANEALKLLDRESFDAAIVDVKMYPVGGVTLLGEIKKRSPSTRVIMITAYPTMDSRDACIKHGAADYRTKPLEIQELKSVVRQLVSP
jgi:DNA-binding NtrC family response regulator